MVRGLLQTCLAPFAAGGHGKTGFLKEIFPFAAESEAWEGWEGLQNISEEVFLSTEEAVSKGYS